MTEDRRTVLSLARLGLTDSGAADALTRLGWSRHGLLRQDAEEALWALSRAPDPNLALRTLVRLGSAMADGAIRNGWAELDGLLCRDPGVRGRLLGVLGSSTALGDHLVANPGRWHGLANSEAAQPGWADRAVQRLLAAVGADPTGPPSDTPEGTRASLTGVQAQRTLRVVYRDLITELAAADLAAVVEPELPVVPFERIGEALAELAIGVLRAALAVAVTEVAPGGQPPRLAVIGMGKCGGAELNYVSDVDVIFVGGSADELGAATKLASTTMRLASACFEVDAALRPEGRAGALVRTLEGYLSYYRRWARTWEFQALLKARPIAGDAELGARYLEAVAPMVWTAADRENFVAEVQAMRRRVADHIPAELLDRELKLGHGGLRDVEFAVQLLQLVHGRTDESLRVASTVKALAALGAGGYVGRDDAANLAASYRFLRLLEHRLQLQKLRRTHLLPADGDTAAWRWLARAAGMRPDGRRDALGVLRMEHTRQSHRARRLHQKLFYRPLLEAVARVPTEAYRLSESSAKARLAALGYASPQGALAHLRALTDGVSRRAAIQSTLLPVLLEFLADTPDPDRGLSAYRRVSEALDDTPWYLRLLRDEGVVAQRLMALLGTSRMVADLLVRAPEALRLLADPNELAGRDPAEVATSLRSAACRHRDLGAAVTVARALRRHELFRIACADLLGLLDVNAVCAGLSSVWTAVLASALDVALRAEIERRQAEPVRIAVIGMGRLGGAELGYSSDADVLFVCDPVDGADETDAVRFASSVAESVRNLLGSPSQDPPLVIDTGLRPEGRSGPLVRTLSSYQAYYIQWAQPWEAQALLRATTVAGDVDLGERFVSVIDPVRYPVGGLTARQATEIRRIKARVDSERLPRGADPSTHTKLGRGGLADVEWTIQLLQLQHAHQVAALRTTSTTIALRAAADAGLLSSADAEVLLAAWKLATKTRNVLTLVRGKQVDQLPSSGRELAAVARALGRSADDDPGEAIDEYRRTTRRARIVVERSFGT
ncbi:MAG: bifunctional [glutamine synthetase] adenylyltransferase/[glutamine synthetase]-adenylyl-L-tyrosine phosphorylase [Pseudonocardiales bacterium]|nr:bifunctional [glutamine synthetase] adenylyltransferase/[glutamine synthetase]-adenylyl-L-tyrosine phosphorylase [Pseudonocardiales bacterium]MBV9729518.1 bifunctional [glutamine synthetase] adenylyltransferase/[glutamine synthetase]-adenylyl-L-tyrosine phosphorylase [Pseudonocardiales bacterium]